MGKQKYYNGGITLSVYSTGKHFYVRIIIAETPEFPQGLAFSENMFDTQEDAIKHMDKIAEYLNLKPINYTINGGIEEEKENEMPESTIFDKIISKIEETAKKHEQNGIIWSKKRMPDEAKALFERADSVREVIEIVLKVKNGE